MLARFCAALATAIILGGCAHGTDDVRQRLNRILASRSTLPVNEQLTRPAPSRSDVQSPVGRERYECSDGATVLVTYLDERASVSIDGASAFEASRQPDRHAIAYSGAEDALTRTGDHLALTSENTSIIVRAGDTLSGISKRLYGEFSHAEQIGRLNQIADPNRIYPGQVLRLPTFERDCRLAGEAADLPPPRVATSALARRRFTPPSAHQPELRRVLATAADRN